MREGLANDESDEVSAALSDDGEPAGLAFSEDADPDRSSDEVEEHAHRTELGSQRHRGQQDRERLERDGDSERFRWDRDLRRDCGEQCHDRDAQESEHVPIDLVCIRYRSCAGLGVGRSVGWEVVDRGHTPLGYDAELCLSWTLGSGIDPCRDIGVCADGGGCRLELYLCSLSLPRCGSHRAIDIDHPQCSGLGFDQASADDGSGLEVEARCTDSALNISGFADGGASAADAHRVDFACDVEISGADDEVRVDLRRFVNDDRTCGLDGGSPVSLLDMDITDLQSTGTVWA